MVKKQAKTSNYHHMLHQSLLIQGEYEQNIDNENWNIGLTWFNQFIVSLVLSTSRGDKVEAKLRVGMFLISNFWHWLLNIKMNVN